MLMVGKHPDRRIPVAMELSDQILLSREFLFISDLFNQLKGKILMVDTIVKVENIDFNAEALKEEDGGK